MSREPPSDIERLHHELFGIVPHKHGTAYERIAAVVMAVMGWHDVEYDRTERPEGLLAAHQIDVVCRRPDGNQERLIIECKDVGHKKVGQSVLLKLVAVQVRLGAQHAAVIASTDFTRGARQVAADHDIALIRLRPYDAATDDGTWVRAVSIEMRFGFVVQTDIQLVTDHGLVTAEDARVPAESWMEARTPDGQLSTTVGQLFAQGRVVGGDDDAIEKALDLQEPMEIESWSGWVKINGLRWTETTLWTTEHARAEATGEPRLVLQQIDEAGEVYSGKVIVTTKLEAWEIDDAVHKVRRRRLP
jgi:hypothetical protein